MTAGGQRPVPGDNEHQLFKPESKDDTHVLKTELPAIKSEYTPQETLSDLPQYEGGLEEGTGNEFLVVDDDSEPKKTGEATVNDLIPKLLDTLKKGMPKDFRTTPLEYVLEECATKRLCSLWLQYLAPRRKRPRVRYL